MRPKILEDPCLNNGNVYVRPNGTERGSVYEGVDTNGMGAITIKGVAGGVGDVNRLPSDGTACLRAMQDIIDRSSKPPITTASGGCKVAPNPMSFNCAYQPNFLPKSSRIMVFENFFYSASGGGVRPHRKGDAINRKDALNDDLVTAPSFPLVTTPIMFRMAARRVCSREWKEMEPKYPVDNQPKDVNIKLCFSLSYTTSFLMDGLHLKPNKEITVAKDVNGSDIEWALGAAYVEAAGVTQPPKVSFTPR